MDLLIIMSLHAFSMDFAGDYPDSTIARINIPCFRAHN